MELPQGESARILGAFAFSFAEIDGEGSLFPRARELQYFKWREDP